MCTVKLCCMFSCAIIFKAKLSTQSSLLCPLHLFHCSFISLLMNYAVIMNETYKCFTVLHNAIKLQVPTIASSPLAVFETSSWEKKKGLILFTNYIKTWEISFAGPCLSNGLQRLQTWSSDTRASPLRFYFFKCILISFEIYLICIHIIAIPLIYTCANLTNLITRYCLLLQELHVATCH